MSNLADSCLAVGDGKAYVACNAYNLFTSRSGDSITVKTKIYIVKGMDLLISEKELATIFNLATNCSC